MNLPRVSIAHYKKRYKMIRSRSNIQEMSNQVSYQELMFTVKQFNGKTLIKDKKPMLDIYFKKKEL